jgi:membrane-associated phospholipid phosphatase
MVKRILASILFAVALGASPAFAQSTALDRMTPALPSAGERRAADIVSWATAITAVALDAKASIGGCSGQDACYHAIVYTGLRVGATYGAVFALKELVHRVRPCAPECASDNPDFSLPSGHTAIAFSTMGGPRLMFSLPLAVSTGGLRVAAGKHWLTDTLAGAGIGLLTSRIR